MESLIPTCFKKIIVAVDGSDNSQTATALLNKLPLPADCTICVLAVLDTPHTPRRQLLVAALEQASNTLMEKGRLVEAGLLHGHPAASLIEFADDYEPSLIVLGAKGLRATLGILLGGVAQQVVEHARWPVLIVRSHSIDWRSILIATDGSIYGQMAVDYFGIFPPLLDKEFHLVHVVPPLPTYEMGNIPRTWQIGTEVFQVSPIEYSKTAEDWQKKDEEKGNTILEQSINSLERFGIHAKPILLHGDAATELLEYTHNNRIDLIAIGSRGLSEVRGWLLGSVSRKLVHYAPCSVLVVKQ